MIRPDEDMLRALAAGVYPPTDAEARAMAAEVLRLRAEVLRYHSLRNRLRSCVSDTNVSSAWDRMRSLILQDAASDGGEL